jgi:hypothetical protein
MERKRITPNSFQQEIVEFLQEKFPERFTGREILDEINKVNLKLDKAKRTMGSLSGTLNVLCENKWVLKSDGNPSRFSYIDDSHLHQISNADSVSNEYDDRLVSDVYQDSVLKSICDKITEIRSKVSALNEKIEKSIIERDTLETQLGPLEEILSKHKQ